MRPWCRCDAAVTSCFIVLVAGLSRCWFYQALQLAAKIAFLHGNVAIWKCQWWQYVAAINAGVYPESNGGGVPRKKGGGVG